MSVPSLSPVSTRTTPWLRLIVAWAVTFGALPYLWGRTLVWTMLTHRLEPRVTGITAVVVLCLLALTWGVRPPARGADLPAARHQPRHDRADAVPDRLPAVPRPQPHGRPAGRPDRRRLDPGT